MLPLVTSGKGLWLAMLVSGVVKKAWANILLKPRAAAERHCKLPAPV